MRQRLLGLLCAGLTWACLQPAFSQDRTQTDELEDNIVPANVYFKNGKLNIASPKGAFRLWFDNRVYLDGAYYVPKGDVSDLRTKLNDDLADDDGQFKFSSGVIVRRARFAVKGTLYEKWFAELDLDFAYNEVELKDMFVGYKFNDRLSVKVGNFKEPMSMERLTSSKYLTFMERPMSVQTFGGGRRIGAAVTGWGNGWWASGGVFGPEVDVIQKERNRGHDGYGLTGRVAISPVRNEQTTLHIGTYGTVRTPEGFGQTDRFAEFRAFPESRVDRRRFIRAEIPNVNYYSTTALELAFRHNKWLLQGEYNFTNISRYKYNGDQKQNLENAAFDGWYASAAYMIIGEHRQYEDEDAEFGAMKVDAKKGGNLEVGARVSAMNMNDFNDFSAVITGGQGISYTAALNWYPNRNMQVALNYTFMDQDKYADDKGGITSADGRPLREVRPEGIDFGMWQVRTMVSF